MSESIDFLFFFHTLKGQSRTRVAELAGCLWGGVVVTEQPVAAAGLLTFPLNVLQIFSYKRSNFNLSIETF